jgi:hypothetical protein
MKNKPMDENETMSFKEEINFSCCREQQNGILLRCGPHMLHIDILLGNSLKLDRKFDLKISRLISLKIVLSFNQ